MHRIHVSDTSSTSAAYRRAIQRIELADQKVTMPAVLALMGIRAYDGQRISCPLWGDLEGDGREFSVHDHWAYCFECGHPWTPVSLYAESKGIRPGQAAAELIKELGVDTRPPARQPPRIHEGYLAEALRAWLRAADPGWRDHQYDQESAGLMARCLGLLSRVHTEDEARRWLDGCKKAMRKLLAASYGVSA